MFPLFLLTLTGCEMIEGLVASGTAPATPAAPPPKDLSAQLDDVRWQLRAGKYKEALAAGEGILGAHPEDDAVWDLVELAAIRANAAAELVDRLSADQAIGGRAERHHALRGTLALQANRLGDALNSAKALRASAPGDAAAIIAQAVARGAPPPEGLTPAESALIALSNPAATIDPAVDGLPGWRVALLRGEARLVRGDRAGAGVDAATAAGGGPRGRSLGALLRIRAANTGAEAWAAAEPAARASVDDGDGIGAGEILDAALPGAVAAWRAPALTALLVELRAKVTEAGDTAAAARLAAVEADAALRAGEPKKARDAAKLAAAAPDLQVRASWSLALASAALGSAADVKTAAAALGEPRAAGARDLAQAMLGEPVALPTAGLDPADGALQALLAAGWRTTPLTAEARAAAAISPDLALWASLLDRAPIDAAADAPPALRAERDLRAWLATGASAALPADLGHPNTVGWNAILSGTAAAADAPGVAAWSRWRAATDPLIRERELGLLAASGRTWRSGPWAPISVFDAPRASDIAPFVAAEHAAGDPIPFAALHHGWVARETDTAQLWHHGVTPFPPGADRAERDAVWDASAHLRVDTLAWLAGAEPFPAAAHEALATAEKAAGLDATAPPSAAKLRASLDGDALLSFRETADGFELLVVAEESARLFRLPRSIAGDVAAYSAALQGGDAAVAAGDRVRAAIIDPAMDVLLGVGKYAVVGPAPLGTLPIAALPEQADGLRFLAAIRHIGYLPTLDATTPPPVDEPEFSLTMLALCQDPRDIATVRRVFPDARLLEGEQATAAALRSDGPKARYLHIGAFPTTPDGGIRFPDGDVSLAELAELGLTPSGMVLGGGRDAEMLAARLSALHTSGTYDVLLEYWAGPPSVREAVTLHYWEGMNRRYTASRALSEARTLALRELGDGARSPGAWAGWLVAGAP